MGITPNFTDADVKKRLDAFLEAIEEEILKSLQKLGEQVVIHAKEIPADVGYRDQSGNLRSSTGYMIFKDGVAVRQWYETTQPKQSEKGAALNGIEKGRALAEKIGSMYKDGYTLVVTAGMNYALYVEAKGRDVLTSAEILARQELPKMLEQLKGNINKAFE